jgi:hypothetical protein
MHRALLIALLLAVVKGVSIDDGNGKHDGQSIIGRTIRGDTLIQIAPAHDSLNVVVFVGRYSCVQCFGSVEAAIDSLRNSGRELREIALIRGTTSAVGRRETLEFAREVCAHADVVAFDDHDWTTLDPWPPLDLVGGTFGRYDVSKTPCVMFADTAGMFSFVPYEKLFGNSSSNDTNPDSTVAKTLLHYLRKFENGN